MKKFRLSASLILAFLMSAIIGFSGVTARSISKSAMIEQLKNRYQWVYIENAPGNYTQLIHSTTKGYQAAAQEYADYLTGLGSKKIYTTYGPLHNALQQIVSSYAPAYPDPEIQRAVESLGAQLYCFEARVGQDPSTPYYYPQNGNSGNNYPNYPQNPSYAPTNRPSITRPSDYPGYQPPSTVRPMPRPNPSYSRPSYPSNTGSNRPGSSSGSNGGILDNIRDSVNKLPGGRVINGIWDLIR